MNCSRSIIFAVIHVVTITSVASACATTSTVLPPAPQATAPLEERDTYYAQRRPIGVVGHANAANNFAFTKPRLPAVVLADGSRVSEPHGLLPAVDEGSATAAAVRRADDIKLLTSVVYTGSTAAISAGLIGLVTSPGLIFNGDEANGYALYLASCAASLAGAVGVVWASDLAEEAEAEKMTAFLLYDADLRRRLALVRPSEDVHAKWLTSPGGVAPQTTFAPMAPPPAIVATEANNE